MASNPPSLVDLARLTRPRRVGVWVGNQFVGIDWGVIGVLFVGKSMRVCEPADADVVLGRKAMTWTDPDAEPEVWALRGNCFELVINGQPVRSCWLRPGDTLRVGPHCLRIGVGSI